MERIKVLHTADWHLGQKFIFENREEEHNAFLKWLIETIKSEEINVLVIAGDVFDTANPPNYAQHLYYNFLKNVVGQLQSIVIVGGNHDSPSMLNAPQQLLKFLDVHVIGCASENIEDEIIEIKNEAKETVMVFGAVPFLRDSDIRRSIAGESSLEREERIKEGIKNHYQGIENLLKSYKEKNIPCIVTGHLCAAGTKHSDEDNKQKNIYIGGLENITIENFPSSADYVALGHIHKAQKLGGTEHIRYSGSPIPLSFSEINDQKVVQIITFEKNELITINSKEVPLYRSLRKIKGSLPKVKDKLIEIGNTSIACWCEIHIETEEYISDLSKQIRSFIEEKELNLVPMKIRMSIKTKQLNELTEVKSLEDLSQEEVFDQLLQSKGVTTEDAVELKKSFLELVNKTTEND